MVKWQGRRGSDNVDDRRGAVGAAGMSGLAMVVVRLVMTRFGVGGLAVLAVGFFALRSIGVDPLALAGGGGQGTAELSAVDRQAGEFSSVILAETETVWGDRFAASNSRYPAPGLVLFSDRNVSACGQALAAMGPFYCPADKKIYIDTTFYAELSKRFGAPGDFAAAYVIAHEVGHHIQTITGISRQVQQAKAGASQVQQNQLQVRMELQADCYAGIWAHDADRVAGILEDGDIEEGLRAASAIGDDALQRQAGRQVKQETFTHGSSAQRSHWFTVGYRQGDVSACDTFSVDQL